MKPIKNLQLFNDLQAVEELLLKHGWCKRAMHDSLGRYCLAGAIKAVVEEPKPDYTRWQNLSDALGDDVVRWNDKSKTTFDDVLVRIREARAALVQ